MSEVTKELLIESQEEVVKGYQEAYDNAPFELKRLCREVLTVQKSILVKMGKSSTKSTKVTPPKEGFFKNPNKSDGELATDSSAEIKNVVTKKGMFKAGKVEDLDLTSHEILNKDTPKKGMFDKPEIEDTEEKANPRRLSPGQTKSIKDLAAQGLNAKQISDKVMIVQVKVEGVLKKMKKQGGGNLIGISKTSKGTLEDEVREYNEE